MIAFQSLEDVRRYREFRDQLMHGYGAGLTLTAIPKEQVAHSIFVMAFTCPSNQRMGARVSRSHICTEKVKRTAEAMKRPVGSNFANEAPANREV